MGRLTINEKKVLYGLIKYPNFTDIEIQKIIKVKGSTYSIIKKKLRDKGYFSTIRMPVFQHLGCKYSIVTYIKLNRKIYMENLFHMVNG